MTDGLDLNGRVRIPMSGTSINTRNTAIKAVGMVSTYFQLFSYFTCMKNMMTSIAFVQDTAIMNVQPTHSCPG
jgi:ABC-type polar amino acid transport system ATPase subunit